MEGREGSEGQSLTEEEREGESKIKWRAGTFSTYLGCSWIFVHGPLLSSQLGYAIANGGFVHT